MTFQGHNNRKKAGGYAEYITGGELRLLQQTACRFKAALETAAWKHYVRAIKESEPVPDAEARRKRVKPCCKTTLPPKYTTQAFSFIPTANRKTAPS
ncbi:hypothetical protein C5K93_001611 [Neisseria gonorrhoeae]